MLVDLYRHQEWADAELWHACEAHPDALADTALWRRLHHIHLVQQAFFAIARGADVRTLRFSKPADYETPSELKAEAQRYHADVVPFVAALDAEALDHCVVVPWFKEPPLQLPVGQALLQAAMHSHYHRAQNATRLRELGGVPPLTDYIVWLWKGKAAPQWA
jgi:uncharacterized damage-inducible protein DinB